MHPVRSQLGAARMARKAASPSPKPATKRRAKKRTSTSTASAGGTRSASASATPAMPDFREMSKMAKIMTPEQAIEMYKANARMALDVINASIEGAARLRKKQFEGEEQVREFQ